MSATTLTLPDIDNAHRFVFSDEELEAARGRVRAVLHLSDVSRMRCAATSVPHTDLDGR